MVLRTDFNSYPNGGRYRYSKITVRYRNVYFFYHINNCLFRIIKRLKRKGRTKRKEQIDSTDKRQAQMFIHFKVDRQHHNSIYLPLNTVIINVCSAAVNTNRYIILFLFIFCYLSFVLCSHPQTSCHFFRLFIYLLLLLL